MTHEAFPPEFAPGNGIFLRRCLACGRHGETAIAAVLAELSALGINTPASQLLIAPGANSVSRADWFSLLEVAADLLALSLRERPGTDGFIRILPGYRFGVERSHE